MKATYLWTRATLAGAIAVALLSAPAISQFTDVADSLGVGTVFAAEGGKGGPGEKGGGGQGGGGPAMKGGAMGKGGPSASASASTTSASKLGRLSMARAFVSPGFDITKVDDPLAPLAQIALYKDMVTGTYDGSLIDAAGTALGNVATVNPVTLDTIEKVNELLGIETSWPDVALEAVAAKATEVLLARRTEETEH